MRKIILDEPFRMRRVECEIPTPKKDEVRIAVKRLGICGSDPTIYRGLHPYVTFPVVLGHEISGVIDAVGEDVAKERIGQRVTVIPHIVCGKCEACKNKIYNFCEELRCTGAEADGAMCDYFCISSEMAVQIPDTMTLDDAALVEPACVAYHGAKRGCIRKGETVLIIGAGPIGVFCMQSCFALGAGKVYVADLDADRLALARRLGATDTVEVGKQSIKDIKDKIDVFYDCVGEKGQVLNNILDTAKRGSRIVVIGVLQKEYTIPKLPDFVQHELSLFGTTMYTPADYSDMLTLMGEKKIVTDGMISHRFGLEKVPEVLDMLVKKKEKTFKILIEVND
ncbi:MAG: alcohol dehydrogenase catalytic domain-containing protein [Oscillospiraceae bacterium]|nr:alcohol dehydrogenase catalytic domain-containing protein [Oscillospiraceae bacterium]